MPKIFTVLVYNSLKSKLRSTRFHRLPIVFEWQVFVIFVGRILFVIAAYFVCYNNVAIPLFLIHLVEVILLIHHGTIVIAVISSWILLLVVHFGSIIISCPVVSDQCHEVIYELSFFNRRVNSMRNIQLFLEDRSCN